MLRLKESNRNQKAHTFPLVSVNTKRTANIPYPIHFQYVQSMKTVEKPCQKSFFYFRLKPRQLNRIFCSGKLHHFNKISARFFNSTTRLNRSETVFEIYNLGLKRGGWADQLNECFERFSVALAEQRILCMHHLQGNYAECSK